MSRQQKLWVRVIGLAILAAFVVNWGIEWINAPRTIKQVREDVGSKGTNGDLFCLSFFSRVLKEDAAILIDATVTDLERLDRGFRAHVTASSEIETQTEQERNASLSGYFFTGIHLQRLNTAMERPDAKAELMRLFSECDARLTKLGVPPALPLPKQPKPGSTEWYIQNR